MNNLTLKYNGTEQTLDAWGYSAPKLTYASRAAGVFTVTMAGADPAADAPIPYDGLIEVYDGRAGAGTAWTGGTRIFVGYRREFNCNADGSSRGVTLVFRDVWDVLERLTYQMVWTGQSGTYTSARVFLFQNLGNSLTPWSYWQTKDQIIDVINFAHTECGIAVQSGTVDPIMVQPIYPCRSPKCADVINLCLTSLPDAITWIDYTTNDGSGNPLPTLHVRQRQNCTAITLPYADGIKHLSSRIRSREDLQVPEVVFQYQTTEQIDGVQWNIPQTDAYPPGVTGLVENACVQAIDLRGCSRNEVNGEIVAAAFDPTSAAFWSDKDRSLQDPTISGLALVNTAVNDGSAHCITVVDHTGANINLTTYPHEYKNGTRAPWMLDAANAPIQIIEAIVTAHVKYSKKYPVASGSPVLETHVIDDHVVQTRIRLTNSPTGAKDYSAQAGGASPEIPPPFLAYLFWCSVNNIAPNIVGGVVTPPAVAPSITGAAQKQWEGQHLIIEPTISTFYTPFHVLNLSSADGGNAAWAVMNAAIYSIEYDFFNGITTINFGPNKKLNTSQFFSMMMMFQTRVMWDNPNVRNTGMDPGGAGSAIGKDTRVQDTTGVAPPAASVHSTVSTPDVSGNQFIFQHDAGAPKMLYSQVNNTGAPITTNYGQVNAPLTDLPAGVVAKWRKVPYKNASCADAYRWVLCSDEILGT